MPGRYLAGENVAKSREGIIQGFVVNVFVQVLDEDIANSRFTEGWIPLRPHDTDGTTLDGVKVHGIQSTLSCKGEEKIHVLQLVNWQNMQYDRYNWQGIVS